MAMTYKQRLAQRAPASPRRKRYLKWGEWHPGEWEQRQREIQEQQSRPEAASVERDGKPS